MKNLLTELHRDESGQTQTEYGLIVALIAVAGIVALTKLGKSIVAKFNEVDDALQ